MIDLFDKAKARRTDPSTSHQAAASVDKIKDSQKVILTALRRYGAMTDEQIFNKLGFVDRAMRISPSGARTRRAELVEKGMVRDSGRKGDTLSGRKTIIWEVANES